MSYFPSMQKGNLDAAKADEHGKIKKETVALQGGLGNTCYFRCRCQMVK